MDGVRLDVSEMSLKPIKNIHKYVRVLGYETISDYNKCEYYYKMFSLTFAQFKDQQGKDCSEMKQELLSEQPIGISYLSDGSYLRLHWGNYSMTLGAPACHNKNVKRYDLRRE